MDRRVFVGAIGGLASCGKRAAVPVVPALAPMVPIAPIRASADRIFRVTVCLRPFRAAGPRLDVERVAEKTVVHNYGHGGSGWSLSWGSGQIAVEKVLAAADGTREVGVIGCGALGLTSAILLQRAGFRVTIYAKERPPEVRSSYATGSWTPDSRIALSTHVDAGFGALWERMCRYSYRMYEGYLGLAGNPVEWLDSYRLLDEESVGGGAEGLPFARYRERVADLGPRAETLGPGQHGFPARNVRRGTSLTFHVAVYAHQLMTDFFVEGGRWERREFQSPGELSGLRERVLVNATGYGARALWKDESIVPVRGQIAWLPPQPEVNYVIGYRGVNAVARRDGIVVQSSGAGEMEGYNDSNETPDREEAERAVGVLGELFAKMRPKYAKG
jgi:D-amino-acid oxidase